MCGPTKHSSIRMTGECSLHYTMEVLRRHFDLKADGYCCTTDDLWRILLEAAARHVSIEETCSELERAPDSNTVRGYLQQQLRAEDIPDLEQRTNQALAEQTPDWLRDRPRSIALDVHDEPYYGTSDPEAPDNWVCRGQARRGTTHFYRCATAYVICRDARVNLAVVFMKPRMTLPDVVERLLDQVRTVGIRIERLYADKAFCSVAVIRYLQQRLPAIIAAPLTAGKGGLRALCCQRRGYRTTHTFRNARDGAVTADVALARTYDRVRSHHRRIRWCAWVCVGVDEPPRQIRKSYRRRFGIETSYRLMEQLRTRTSSRNPALRFLFMALALILLNVWIALHWLYLRVQGPGPRRVARSGLRLSRLQLFLSRAIESCYGCLMAIEPEGP